jgi:predicted nucleic acid-binding protein
MKYLFDTNVISEIRKSDCNAVVKSFVDEIPPEDIFLSVISIGEISYGVEKLPSGRKKHELSLWLYTKVPQWFSGRIIPLDMEVMLEWGKLRAGTKRTIPVADSLVAASAISHRMILVTRNTKDFEDIEGIKLINPWDF